MIISIILLISSFDLTVILKEITFWSLLRIEGSREDFLFFCFVFLFNEDCVQFSTKRNYWSETHLHHDTSVCYHLFSYKVHSAIRRTPNLATSLLHVFKLKIWLKYLVIRRTIVWGVKISQVYCKFFHKLKKKRKNHVPILVYR